MNGRARPTAPLLRRIGHDPRMTADPAERRYFISHSSRDKAVAVELAEALRGQAWIDLYELELGDILLEEIAAGIQDATDFVLLWSKHSAESKWVRFEFHMAFVRHLEDNAIAIRIVLLDDAPVPLTFRPFLHSGVVQSAAEAAERVEGRPPRVRSRRAFINRNAEVDAIEAALYSPRVGHLWLWGMNGIGKRAIAGQALQRVVADRTLIRAIEVRPGTGFVELDLIVSALIGAEPPPPTLTEKQAAEHVAAVVGNYASAGGIWSFAEAQHWLDEEGRPGVVLDAVLNALAQNGTTEPGKLAVVTSTRRPTLRGTVAQAGHLHSVRGLKGDFGVALLRSNGAEAPDDILRQASEQLDGHPLALEIVAPKLGDTEPDWEDFRARAATGVVDQLRLEPVTETLLERLAAVDGPFPAESYAHHLAISSDQLQRAIDEGIAYSLIDQREVGLLTLHPLIRDFYMRAFRRRDTFLRDTSDLADRARAQLNDATPGTATYVEALLVTFRLLCWAGRLREALDVRQNLYGTLYETAVELYNQRRYEDARRYLELVVQSTDDHRSARLYLARTLAYLGEVTQARAMMDEMLEESPDDYHVWRIRGRVEYIAREFSSAVRFYERANELRPGMPSVLRDLGQARMRVEDWFGARAALQGAIDRQRRDPDPYLAFQYSQVLEHFGEYQEASRMVAQAIRRDPHNAVFHHRRGRIAEALGDRATAAREYEECLRLEPDYVESVLSLASMAIGDNDLDRARSLLRRAQRVRNARPAVLLNIEAKLYLKERDFDLAREVVERALREERDIPSLDLAARIELEAIATGAARCSDVSDGVRRYAEEIRVKGNAKQADAVLAELVARGC
jgi:tetratricopeptide (TPR) repeat protein